MSVFYSWRDIVSLERYCYNDLGFVCTKTPSEKAEKSQVKNLSVYIHLSSNQKRPFFTWLFKHMDVLLINHTKWWIIIVKHPSLKTHRKNISLMKINNIRLMLCTHIILSPSFVI